MLPHWASKELTPDSWRNGGGQFQEKNLWKLKKKEFILILNSLRDSTEDFASDLCGNIDKSKEPARMFLQGL